MSIDCKKLKRPLNVMPLFVKTALQAEGLLADYKARPAYQQNDYIAWIDRAKRNDTKMKRLEQMLAELREGGIYMKMNHPPSRKE